MPRSSYLDSLMRRKPQQRLVLVVMGQTGSGKSSVLKALLLRSPKSVICVDPLWEHAPRPGDTIIRPSIADEHGDYNRAAALAWSRQNCRLIVDEIDRAQDPGQPPPYWISGIARWGRHRLVDLVVAARRPVEIHPTLRAQADVLVTFFQSDPLDLARLRQWGFPDERVKRLGRYEWLALQRGVVTMGDTPMELTR